MNKRASSFCLSLVLAAGYAHAFRDDLPRDPATDCLPAALGQSREVRHACALHAVARACESSPAMLVDDVARVLGVPGVQVRKAMGRHMLGSLERGDLCARGEGERLQVLVAAENPKKARSGSPKEWLLSTLAGPGEEIDHAAVSRAIEARNAMVAASEPKRAGLPATPAGWTNLTGFTQSSGRINHIQFLDGTGNNLLAGADGGGIWRTSNGGTSWTAINDFLGSLSITNFAMATNDANTIYAATNMSGSHTYFPYGIVKSTNGGTSWSQIALTNPSTNPDFTYVNRVAVHPTNSAIVLAATGGGAYQSLDGGTSWTKIGGLATRANYVAFHPNDGNRRAVTYHDGTVRYTTTGDLLGAGAATSTVLAGGLHAKLAYAKSDTSRLYVLVTDGTTNNTRLRISTTGGASWTEGPTLPVNDIVYNGGYLSYTGCLWVDPLNANRVAVCEAWAGFTVDVTAPTPVWKSLYSGWVDFHGIVEHPGYNGAGNRTVFFMDDGGLYRVTDIDALDTNPSPFTQFTRIETGMTVTQVYSVSGHGGNPILGAQDVAPRVYKTDTGDATNRWRFTRRPPGDLVCPSCSWIGDGATTAASTANPLVLYGSRQYLDMIRSNDGGATSVSIVGGSALADGRGATVPNYNAAFIAPFVLDPSNQSRMLAGGQSLWRTNDADTGNPPTWTAIRAPYTETACGSTFVSTVSVIAVAPSNPDIVWIAHSCAGRIFRSANATQPVPAWTEVATLPAAANLRGKASIMIDRTNPNVVWVGLSGYYANTLFKTTDGGATTGNWTAVAGLPGAPVNAMLQHPADASWLYAATGVGLFASDNGGATWSTTNEGPANIVVRSLDWNTTGTTSELLVGTYGRGVWKASVTFAPTTYTLSVSKSGAGTVTSNPAGIDCGTTCAAGFAAGTTVQLTATPTTSTYFSGWTLACAGSGACSLLMNSSHSVTALFNPRTDVDFNGDGKADVLYRNSTTGQVYRLLGSGLVFSSGAVAYNEANTAWKVVADADFNGDGTTDILYRNDTTGAVYYVPFATSGLPSGGAPVITEPNLAWKIVHAPDIDGNGKADILYWNSTTGQVYAMLMDGAAIGTQGLVYTEPDTAWKIVAVGDFAGSGRKNQLLWRNGTTGQVYLMTVTVSGGVFSQTGVHVYTEGNTAWKIIGAADFNGDGKSDILWRNGTTGQVYLMLMNGASIASQGLVYTEGNTAWKIVAQGDYDGNRTADLLWRNDTTGAVYMMLMNGLAIAGQGLVYSEGNTAWKILGPWEYGLASGILP